MIVATDDREENSWRCDGPSGDGAGAGDGAAEVWRESDRETRRLSAAAGRPCSGGASSGSVMLTIRVERVLVVGIFKAATTNASDVCGVSVDSEGVTRSEKGAAPLAAAGTSNSVCEGDTESKGEATPSSFARDDRDTVLGTPRL